MDGSNKNRPPRVARKRVNELPPGTPTPLSISTQTSDGKRSKTKRRTEVELLLAGSAVEEITTTRTPGGRAERAQKPVNKRKIKEREISSSGEVYTESITSSISMGGTPRVTIPIIPVTITTLHVSAIDLPIGTSAQDPPSSRAVPIAAPSRLNSLGSVSPPLTSSTPARFRRPSLPRTTPAITQAESSQALLPKPTQTTLDVDTISIQSGPSTVSTYNGSDRDGTSRGLSDSNGSPTRDELCNPQSSVVGERQGRDQKPAFERPARYEHYNRSFESTPMGPDIVSRAEPELYTRSTIYDRHSATPSVYERPPTGRSVYERQFSSPALRERSPSPGRYAYREDYIRSNSYSVPRVRERDNGIAIPDPREYGSYTLDSVGSRGRRNYSPSAYPPDFRPASTFPEYHRREEPPRAYEAHRLDHSIDAPQRAPSTNRCVTGTRTPSTTPLPHRVPPARDTPTSVPAGFAPSSQQQLLRPSLHSALPQSAPIPRGSARNAARETLAQDAVIVKEEPTEIFLSMPPTRLPKRKALEYPDGARKTMQITQLDVGEFMFSRLRGIVLPDETGRRWNVTEIAKERGVVIFCLPTTNTEESKQQVLGYMKINDELQNRGFSVFGVSKAYWNKVYKEQNICSQFPFPFLLDADRQLINALGAVRRWTLFSHWIFERGGKLIDRMVDMSVEDSTTKALRTVEDWYNRSQRTLAQVRQPPPPLPITPRNDMRPPYGYYQKQHARSPQQHWSPQRRINGGGPFVGNKPHAQGVKELEHLELGERLDALSPLRLPDARGHYVDIGTLAKFNGVVIFMTITPTSVSGSQLISSWNMHLRELEERGYKVYGLSPRELKGDVNPKFTFLHDKENELIKVLGAANDAGFSTGGQWIFGMGGEMYFSMVVKSMRHDQVNLSSPERVLKFIDSLSAKV